MRSRLVHFLLPAFALAGAWVAYSAAQAGSVLSPGAVQVAVVQAVELPSEELPPVDAAPARQSLRPRMAPW